MIEKWGGYWLRSSCILPTLSLLCWNNYGSNRHGHFPDSQESLSLLADKLDLQQCSHLFQQVAHGLRDGTEREATPLAPRRQRHGDHRQPAPVRHRHLCNKRTAMLGLVSRYRYYYVYPEEIKSLSCRCLLL